MHGAGGDTQELHDEGLEAEEEEEHFEPGEGVFFGPGAGDGLDDTDGEGGLFLWGLWIPAFAGMTEGVGNGGGVLVVLGVRKPAPPRVMVGWGTICCKSSCPYLCFDLYGGISVYFGRF